MHYLFLHNNIFEGAIPDGLHRLSNLNQVLVSTNALSGTVPEAIRHWMNLQAAVLNNNYFTGSVPLLPSSCYPLALFSYWELSRTYFVPSVIRLNAKGSSNNLLSTDLEIVGEGLLQFSACAPTSFPTP